MSDIFQPLTVNRVPGLLLIAYVGYTYTFPNYFSIFSSKNWLGHGKSTRHTPKQYLHMRSEIDEQTHTPVQNLYQFKWVIDLVSSQFFIMIWRVGISRLFWYSRLNPVFREHYKLCVFSSWSRQTSYEKLQVFTNIMVAHVRGEKGEQKRERKNADERVRLRSTSLYL